jgi:hypothetical protein
MTRTINPPKVGERFLHKRVVEPGTHRPMEYIVTRVASGTVYYKPIDSGHSECCDVADFYQRVVI